MAYPTAAQIRSMLPGDPSDDFDGEIELAIASWKARVADAAGLDQAPENDPLAEDIVREGAYGRAYKRLLIRDYQSETPAADGVIRDAEAALTRYDARKQGTREPGRVNRELVSNPSRAALFDERRLGYPVSEHLADGIDDAW